MRKFLSLFFILLAMLCFVAVPAGFAGQGGARGSGQGGNHGGGQDSGSGGGSGKSDQGILYGDMCKVLRYAGGEETNGSIEGFWEIDDVYWTATYNGTLSTIEPEYDASSSNIFDLEIGYSETAAIGGMPILSTEQGVAYDEIGNEVEVPLAAGPSLCVQPIDEDGLPIDLVIVYDLEHERFECEVNATYIDDVQEVELGRLNLGRSPDSVLEHSYEEAVDAINACETVRLDPSGRLLLVYDDDTVKTIDSPLENLALYQAVMKDGYIKDADSGKLSQLSWLANSEKTVDDLVSAASFLAGAADKTGVMSVDKIIYLNSLLGLNGSNSTNPQEFDQYINFAPVEYSRGDLYGTRGDYDVSTDTYDSGFVTILVSSGEDTWTTARVSLVDDILGGADFMRKNIEGFAKMCDDALQVLEYLHEYAVPDDELSDGRIALRKDDVPVYDSQPLQIRREYTLEK